MKKLTRLWGAVALVGIIAVAGAACVSSGDLDSIRSDLTDVQQTVESVSSDVEAIGRRLGALEGTGGVTAPDPDPDPGLMVTTDIIHATFDLSPEIEENIRSNVTLFGINQQQPLQGYLSILTLALLERVGVTPPSRITNTGPALVRADIVDTAPTRFVNEDLKNDPSQLNYTAILHAECSYDTFWCTVQAGIDLAAEDAGVTVNIQAPPAGGTVEDQAQLIDAAVANRPDGILVTYPNEGLKASIQRAVDSGIPVIVINSSVTGSPSGDGINYRTFLGQDEREGGIQAGHRLAEAAGTGSHSAVCINHQVGHSGLDQRCDGFKTALAKDGITDFAIVEITNDAVSSQQTLSNYYASNPGVDIFLTLGPNGASPFYGFIEEEDIDDADFVHGTFDFSPVIADNIRSGRTEFGIDQQPFLQGYGGLTWLYLTSLYRVLPPDEVTLTGPGFITTDNIDAIPADAQGYRNAWDTELDITVVHHGFVANTWWETMNDTINLAAANLGVKVEILFPQTNDLNRMRDLIGEALTTSPNALAVSIPDPDLLGPPINQFLEAGIPVVAFNATKGGPEADGIDYLSYIGQDEYTGGLMGGRAIADVAPSGSNAICVNQEVGHVGLTARCAGFIAAMNEAGISIAGSNGVLGVEGGNIIAATQTISDFLAANPSVNIVFTLGPDGAKPYYAYLADR